MQLPTPTVRSEEVTMTWTLARLVHPSQQTMGLRRQCVPYQTMPITIQPNFLRFQIAVLLSS